MPNIQKDGLNIGRVLVSFYDVLNIFLKKWVQLVEWLAALREIVSSSLVCFCLFENCSVVPKRLTFLISYSFIFPLFETSSHRRGSFRSTRRLHPFKTLLIWLSAVFFFFFLPFKFYFPQLIFCQEAFWGKCCEPTPNIQSPVGSSQRRSGNMTFPLCVSLSRRIVIPH